METMTNMLSKDTVFNILKASLYAPRAIIEWVTSFIEFLTDHTHHSVGHIMIKASPMLAPTLSMFAIYGTLHNQFGPQAAAIMTFVIEAVGFAAVYAKTRIEEHNRKASLDERRSTKVAGNAVWAYFVVSELLILGFEAIPAWVLWWTGGLTNTGEQASVIYSIRHSVPLLFPVFSYIGANIFSLMDVLDAIDTAKDEATTTQLVDLSSEVESLRDALNVAKKTQLDASAEALKLSGLLNESDANKRFLAAELEQVKAALFRSEHDAQAASEQLRSLRSENEKAMRDLAIQTTQVDMLKVQLSGVTSSLERYQEHNLALSTERHAQPVRTRAAAPVRKSPNGKKANGERGGDSRFERRIQLLDLF